MRHFTLCFLAVALAAVVFLAVSPPPTWAINYKVLHAFSGTPDGGGLFDRLAIDANGNLYGTTWAGGAYSEGTVFELEPVGGGKWKETILHSFCADWPQCSDGELPMAGLVLDTAGNLFGTTGRETFQLTPGPSGWDIHLIHDEGSNADLIMDKQGNLYGEIGLGNFGGGAAAELSPSPTGWTYNVLYSFCHFQSCHGGSGPNYGLSWDAAGNLYGVTSAGGKENFGVVFQLEHTPSGWKEHVLHNFRGNRDGFYPYGGVVVDNLGNVYGSTLQGGRNRCGGPGCGTIYKLTKQPDGHWKETILYRFPKLKNGAGPTGTLALDAAGNLHGVAGGGTGPCGGGGCGVVFRLAHNPDNTWTYTVLHRFKGSDGALPIAGVILDAKGNIYGTTSTGGEGGYGVVFKITE